MKNIKEVSEVCLIEQYKVLKLTARHYDYQFWIIPGVNYTVVGLLYGLILGQESRNPILESFLLWVIPVISFAFLLQMLNERAYQKKNKLMLGPIVAGLKLDKIKVAEAQGWIGCWLRCVNAPFLITTIMFILFLMQVLIAIII